MHRKALPSPWLNLGCITYPAAKIHRVVRLYAIVIGELGADQGLSSKCINFEQHNKSSMYKFYDSRSTILISDPELLCLRQSFNPSAWKMTTMINRELASPPSIPRGYDVKTIRGSRPNICKARSSSSATLKS